MSAPLEGHPSTPTAPRVSEGPEESAYPSPAAPDRLPTPQHLRSPQVEDADLRLIRARYSQGQPLPPPQTDPRDPASPEEDEQWFPDPGASVDRGGWENPKTQSHETPKQTAPITTSTPQTAPRHERPPSPHPTTIPTRTTTPGTDPRIKGSPATSSSPGGPPTAETPSLQELGVKMSRYIEAQEARYKLGHPPQPSALPKPTTTELLPYPEVPLQPSSLRQTTPRPTQPQQFIPTPTSTPATQHPPTVRPTPSLQSTCSPPHQYIYTPEPQTVAQAPHIPEVTTLATLKARILAS